CGRPLPHGPFLGNVRVYAWAGGGYAGVRVTGAFRSKDAGPGAVRALLPRARLACGLRGCSKAVAPRPASLLKAWKAAGTAFRLRPLRRPTLRREPLPLRFRPPEA